ncbi:MAG TPA: homocysteine S-methyltransferase family protein [Terriglobales bacterium]|nr:homocysteine S-methyltransferase family protein [Terriglobales bacterium]
MKTILERLAAGETLIGDGALGTMLIARGLEPGQSPESLNLSRPDWVEEVARGYVEAGADFVTTNSFGGSPARLARYGLEDRLEELNRAAVAIARRVADGRAHVLASVGPSGRVLEPYGDGDPGAIAAGYERQIRALAEAGADLIGIETMTDLAEAVLATMTFEGTRRGFFTVMGVSIEQAARGLAEAGADIVGSNCGNGSEAMVAIAREFRARTSLPIAIQPNAGLPEMRGGAVFYPETPETMAAHARALRADGVAIIGGCCGTTPAHIRALREALG